MQITSIAVFCGSRNGNNPLFEEESIKLGHLLAKKGITLIYGGGNKGLMSAVSNAVLEKNGKVVGIIPTLLAEREHQHNGITELIVVESMHVRKKMLFEKCDAVIILPGGYGTLDELFETITWNQLSIHDKKIFLLNIDGFYDLLLQHITKMKEENFLYEGPDSAFTVLSSAEEIEYYI